MGFDDKIGSVKYMTLREKLIVLRDKAGLSQMALADQLGISRQAVTRWESGDTTPSMDKLKALAKIYGVSLDWLCNDTNESDSKDEQIKNNKDILERNEIKQRELVRNKKRWGIVAIIIIVTILIGWLLCQKVYMAKPMGNMPNKTIAPEESDNAESFSFGW